VDTQQLAWFAGLFEGEGNIAIAKNGGTRLTIRMTDRDIIERVAELFPVQSIQVVVPKPARAGYSQPKTQYAWRVSDPARVREILQLILPWLGQRRSAAAREVLAHLATRPGIGGYQRLKTHCAAGHEYTPENTYVRPGTEHRHCRTCRTEWSTTYRNRKAERGQVISA
jgi:hypothetical protein